MKHILFILIPLILVGCADPMTNDDLIAEIAKCEEGGFKPVVVHSQWDGRIIAIQCVPIFDENGKRIKQ